MARLPTACPPVCLVGHAGSAEQAARRVKTACSRDSRLLLERAAVLLPKPVPAVKTGPLNAPPPVSYGAAMTETYWVEPPSPLTPSPSGLMINRLPESAKVPPSS
jgi:hypothetical protein